MDELSSGKQDIEQLLRIEHARTINRLKEKLSFLKDKVDYLKSKNEKLKNGLHRSREINKGFILIMQEHAFIKEGRSIFTFFKNVLFVHTY
jgi:predicted RNase H-like nuclease (RuvC/YqgF family)